MKRKTWKRFTLTVMGAVLVWVFLHEHRNWIWAYFESVMLLDSPDAGQIAAAQAIASAGISALTTAFVASSAVIAALVLFFVTGDTAALTAMFKFTGTATAAGTVASSTSVAAVIDEKVPNLNLREHRE